MKELYKKMCHHPKSYKTVCFTFFTSSPKSYATSVFAF